MYGSMKRLIGAGLVSIAAVLLLAASPAAAQNAKYVPSATGRTFDGGAGGWKFTSSSAGLCVPAVLCPIVDNSHRQTGSNGYLRTRLGALLGVGATSKGILTSPGFTYRGVKGKAPGSLRLSLGRRSNVGQLLSVTGNSATYEVELQDLTANHLIEVIPPRTLDGADSWTSKVAHLGVSQMKVGHRYRIRIATTYHTGATVLPGGSADYDNVVLLARQGAGAGGNGGGTLSSSELRILILGSAPHSVRHKGSRLMVRLKCPRRIHARCRIRASASLKRHGVGVGHAKRTRIRAGHHRRVVLHAKRRFARKLRHRHKVWITERVRAGGAHVRVTYKVKLVHHR